MIAGVAGVALVIILLFVTLALFFMRRKKKRKRDRKTAYARITLDEGEDWVLEPYRPESFHGDALGVYSAISNPPLTHPEVSQSSESSRTVTPPSSEHGTTSTYDTTARVSYEADATGPLTTVQYGDARTALLPPRYSVAISDLEGQSDAASSSGGHTTGTTGARER
jgi:hypothetical protein